MKEKRHCAVLPAQTKKQLDHIYYRRIRQEKKGVVVCEQHDEGGDFCCSHKSDFWHRMPDGERIPMCKKHRCKDCVPMTGAKKMKLFIVTMPDLSNETLWDMVDDCERKVPEISLTDYRLYFMVQEILKLRGEIT